MRDFDDKKLAEYEERLEGYAKEAVAAFPGAKYELQVIEQYRNMYNVLKHHPEIEAHAVEALKRLDIKPTQHPIRGGTDGARLSFMGLPTPNIFAGGHNFHANTEYVAIQDMQLATKVVVELAQVWEEKA